MVLHLFKNSDGKSNEKKRGQEGVWTCPAYHQDLNKSGYLINYGEFMHGIGQSKNNHGLYQTENRKRVFLQQNIYISFFAILEIEVR